jgi:succinyl-diaminopimelate desuccinylase
MITQETRIDLTLCLKHCRALIERPSVSPDDQGCQAYIERVLTPMGFICNAFPQGKTSNLLATRPCQTTTQHAPHLIFIGHTDVVPATPSEWQHPPFTLTQDKQGRIYGRGIADMKGGLAAMMTACAAFLTQNPDYPGKLSWMITSDEEGDGTDGTPHLLKAIQNQEPDFFKDAIALVGEPSSSKQTGDTIKIGRRGSLHGQLTYTGKAGHIAYPKHLINPIHESMAALNKLCAIDFNDGDEHFDPSSLQCYSLKSESSANNVTPENIRLNFNVRFSPKHGEQAIKKQIIDCIEQTNLKHSMTWKTPTTQPYLSKGKGHLRAAAIAAITSLCGAKPMLSTEGGTSDGRHLATTGAEVLELGLPSATIHQANEHVHLHDLDKLCQIYYGILQQLMKAS